MTRIAAKPIPSPRRAVECLELVLPAPPSANNLFYNRKEGGRGKTQAYRDWIIESGWRLQQQNPGMIDGSYEIEIIVGKTNVRDIANSEKALSDLLVRHGVVIDDSLAERIVMTRSGEDHGVRIILKAWDLCDDPAASDEGHDF